MDQNCPNDIDEATEIFTREFTRIIGKHASLKTIQNRKNYIPYISKEIKEIVKTQRNSTQSKATVKATSLG